MTAVSGPQPGQRVSLLDQRMPGVSQAALWAELSAQRPKGRTQTYHSTLLVSQV